MKHRIRLTLMVVGAVMVLCVPVAIGMQKHRPTEKVVTNTVNVPVPPLLDEYSVYNLVNDERARVGLNKLVLDPRIEQAAQTRCRDMVDQNYWSHTDPQGRLPWHLFDENGYDYHSAGENIAEKYATSGGLVRGWMNSTEHRSNILKPDFRSTGVAVCNRSDTSSVIVQEFASPR